MKGSRALASTAVLVFVVASLASGFASMARDLEAALREPGSRVFSAEFEDQARRVREAVPPGVRILVVAANADEWEARLWQRAFYPRNPVAVRFPPVDDAERRDAGFVLSIGPPAPELRLRSPRPIDGPKPVVLGSFGE